MRYVEIVMIGIPDKTIFCKWNMQKKPALEASTMN